MKIFYRIEHNESGGIWYNKCGEKIESIADELPMDYDPNHIGYISCVGSLSDIKDYFGILFEKLLNNNHRLIAFKTSYYKEYNGYFLIPINEYQKIKKEEILITFD